MALNAVGSGGKPWRLTNPSRSLLYRFRTGTSEEILAGATLEVDDHGDVAPGDAFFGSLEFWTEDVRPLLRVGEIFDVWYDGHVGTGEVLDVVVG